MKPQIKMIRLDLIVVRKMSLFWVVLHNEQCSVFTQGNTKSWMARSDLSFFGEAYIILYRVEMIITPLRYFDNGELSPEYTCIDEDFEIA